MSQSGTLFRIFKNSPYANLWSDFNEVIAALTIVILFMSVDEQFSEETFKK